MKLVNCGVIKEIREELKNLETKEFNGYIHDGYNIRKDNIFYGEIIEFGGKVKRHQDYGKPAIIEIKEARYNTSLNSQSQTTSNINQVLEVLETLQMDRAHDNPRQILIINGKVFNLN